MYLTVMGGPRFNMRSLRPRGVVIVMTALAALVVARAVATSSPRTPAQVTPVEPAPRVARREPAPMPPHNPDRYAASAVGEPGTLGGALRAMSPARYALFMEGREAFTTAFTPAMGLGPYFEETSCAACHFHPTVGGSSLERLVTISPGPPPGYEAEHHPAHALPGWAPRVPPPDASPSRPRPLYGLGLIEDVPEAVIVAGCDPDDLDGDGVRGRPAMYGGVLHRFGSKAHQRTVRDFAQNALFDDMNVTSGLSDFHGQDRDALPDPEVSERYIDRLAEFVRGLAPPPRAGAHPEGEAVFARVGCAACHRQDLGPQARGAFTDLCLHDMGPALANGVTDKAARPQDYRTPPLWGLRHQRMLLHDGRARTVEAAILAHGGEAAASRARFAALPPDQRAALLAFLQTL